MSVLRVHALVALGLVRARRGDPQAWAPLDEALASALPRREFQWIGPVALARAEAAWLEGRPKSIAAEIEPALEFPMRRGDPYAAAVAYWSSRAGLTPELVAASDEQHPELLEMAGDWAGSLRALAGTRLSLRSNHGSPRIGRSGAAGPGT